MARATPEAVRAVIQAEPNAELGGHITAAAALVTHLESKDVASLLSEDLKTQIEIYIAAHLYALYDPQYQMKMTGGASAQYQGQTGKRFESTWWGQQAIMFDVTGQLAAINEGAKPIIRVHWLGLSECERTNWWER